jgi:long-chain acyl-CoA synthetase
MSQTIRSFNEALLSALEMYAHQTCLKIKLDGRYQDISYRRLQRLTWRMVAFFHQQGITQGQRVALVADNSLEWLVTCLACFLTGGVVVPLRVSLSPDTLRFILADAQATAVVLQNSEHLESVLSYHLNLPDLKVILILSDELEIVVDSLSLTEILYQTLGDVDSRAYQKHALAIPQDALAAICYVYAHNVSSSAADMYQPKGAVFDHSQWLGSMYHLAQWLIFTEDDLAFTARPWSEAPSLLLTLHYLISGIPNALPETVDRMIESMRQVSPTIVMTMPYSLETFYETCLAEVKKQPEANQTMFQWALAKGREYHTAGEGVSEQLSQEYRRANMTFFSQFRGQLGGRLRLFYATGGSLSAEVAEFFVAIGVPILNAYSLTEAGGFPAVSQSHWYRAGECGPAAPGFELQVSAEGEILVRGDTIMRGYWQRPVETRLALSEGGWLRSGDEGYLDEAGHLYITGRRDHVMVLSTGRKFSPMALEQALTYSPFISQAAIFGEGKPYVSAMLVPDLLTLATHFETVRDEAGNPITSTAHPHVKALLEQVISEVNQKLDRWEQICEYSLLEQPFSQEIGELTPSMRISRHVVAERYAAQIEAMYPTIAQLGPQDVNQVEVDPERLRDLLEKESILDAWVSDAGIEFLFDLARDKQIDAPSMVNICDLAIAVSQMENEEKPLSTALVVGDPAFIARVLPPSQIQLLYHDHIRRMRKVLITLAKIVDGQVLGYVIDKYGYVRGIHKLQLDLGASGSLLMGPQFRHHAAISQQCDAVVFFVPAGGRQVRVFANGELVGRYTNGDWIPEKLSQLPALIKQISQDKQYDLHLIRRILRCAFQMSEKNWGAIFMFGAAETIMAYSDISEISSFAMITSVSLDSLSDQELINFAKQDGATVIDVSGRFFGCMVLLRPDAATQAEIGPGKGARHSSAAKMSAEAQCLAITVSQDGPITIYSDGHQILSL